MTTRFRILLGVIAVTLALAVSPARGQQVIWGSPVGVDSETSAGASVPVDASFTFQVGAFFENGIAGWEPLVTNTEEWADHWLSADSAAYDETYRTFTGSCLVDGSFAGRQGYIWGFSGESADGEWILLSDPGWTFPAGSSGRAFPPSWQTGEATAVVVGAMDSTPGAAFHLRTAQIAVSPPPFVPSEQWLGMYFTAAELAAPLISDWSADPDRDGMSNLLEMAIGAPPRVAGAREHLPELGFVEAGGNFFLSLAVKRAPNVAAVLGAEVSGDLVQWEGGAEKVIVLSDDPDELLVRDSVSVGAGGARYLRLRVSLEE